MECQNCSILKARIILLESEIARLKGRGPQPEIQEEENSCIEQIFASILNNPSVTPNDIKTIDFGRLEREVESGAWNGFMDVFTEWAAINVIKAVAFMVCFQSAVKGSKAVKLLLEHIKAKSKCERKLLPFLDRVVFELFRVRLCSFSEEELETARDILADYVEASLSSDTNHPQIVSRLHSFLNNSEGRAWEFIRLIVWPAFPSSEGSLQDKLIETLLRLIKELEIQYINNLALKEVLKLKLDSM
jgi:hypothetical protein